MRSFLTAQGTDLARRLVEVQQFAGKWSQQQARVAASAAHPQHPAA